MSEYLLICIVALLASGLTLFSGFGLGTLLLPAFALFFPVPAAIAMTALVHFANNLFKLALLGRHGTDQPRGIRHRSPRGMIRCAEGGAAPTTRLAVCPGD